MGPGRDARKLTQEEEVEMSDIEAFRAETREWLKANCPEEMRRPIVKDSDMCWGGRNPRFQSEAQRVWLERMAERGWTVPTWPKPYGGGGLGKEEAAALAQEMNALGCRLPLHSFGIWMLGPVLLKYGSEEQRLEHLPKIARGEIRWCQGYSEPNAGSDLASLATRAELVGDHFVVNGQKVWTSYADESDWIFCLVRTDSARKQAGISFLLFDMRTPGVTTRPTLLISGKSPFCETFFDNVEVPARNLVGELHGGWSIAKYLLTHEREMISGIGSAVSEKSVGQLAVESVGVDAQGRLLDLSLRSQIASFEADETAFAAWMQMTGDRARRGEGHPAVASALKFYGAELNKRRWELRAASGGADALEWEGARSKEGEVARTWLRSKGNSIEGGTSEVQLNVVAKHILGLPGA
jgi:acyl-CoA dehydrogenase